MNAPVSRSSAALLAAGTVAILLLGAFSRNPVAPVIATPTFVDNSPADAVVESAGGPELPAGLSPGLADIIRLAQSHVDESVILAFIHNSGQTYSPKADEILYLSDLGLSQTVIAALFKDKPSSLPEPAASADAMPVAVSAEPPPPVAPPPIAEQDATAGQFYKALTPYGTWTQVPDYGLCWQPMAETVNPDWRPYVDQGQWLDTENGWYWHSDYSWGWAVFHYGRWSKHTRLGWVWVPDKVWGPAWVSWRIALSYSGWAPLPPGVGLANVAGLTFHNRRVAADFDFGLPAGWFTFVSEGNFLNRDLPSYAIPASHAATIYTRSLTVNNYSIANQKVFNFGPGRAGIIASTPRETTSFLIKEAPARNPARATEMQFVRENNFQPLPAMVSSKAEFNTLPRQRLALPARPPQQLQTAQRRLWTEDYPASSRLAGVTRWELLNGREPFSRDEDVEPSVRAPKPEPERRVLAPELISSKPAR